MKSLRFNKNILLFVGLLIFSACSTSSQSRISDNLKHMAKGQTVAILPVEISDRSQKEAASMFRRSLYANLVQAQFKVQERYLVDSLLAQAGLTEPSQYRKIGIARLGEILGVDAVVFSKIDNVDRTYLILHSSINMGVSADMIDTRTGEILWQGKESASDFTGIAKIPTGMFAAITAPVYFVTNKLNLRKLTSAMTGKMTSPVKKPEEESKAAQVADKPKPATAKPAVAKAEHKAKVELAQLPPPKQMENKITDHLTTKKTPKNADSKPKMAGSRSAAKEDIAPSFFYTLQVGAYRTKEFAESMINGLASKGYNAFLSMIKKGNSPPLYKVQVERFDDAEKAQMFSKELENREHIQAFTLKIDTN